MVAEIKYIVLLLCISLFASKSIRYADACGTISNRRILAVFDDCSFFACLNEIKCCFFTDHASDTSKNSSTNGENNSGEVHKKEEKRVPCFLEFLVRTTDRSPHDDKWKTLKHPFAKILKEKLKEESIPCQLGLNDCFMPDLEYYIYTLEKIVI